MGFPSQTLSKRHKIKIHCNLNSLLLPFKRRNDDFCDLIIRFMANRFFFPNVARLSPQKPVVRSEAKLELNFHYRIVMIRWKSIAPVFMFDFAVAFHLKEKSSLIRLYEVNHGLKARRGHWSLKEIRIVFGTLSL